MLEKLIKSALLAASLLFVLLLSGCQSSSAEELYSLPQLSNAYLKLQDEIDALLSSGAEYSAPTSGTNRQAVQLQDIDGDGVNEAIVFLRFPGTNKPQKICIFRNEGGNYEEVARIEGEGTGIDSIHYINMDAGEGVKEIAVGWTIASGVNMLSVYSMKGFQVTDILNTDYTRYVAYDLDGDDGTEILVLRLSATETGGEAELFALRQDGEITSTTAVLSNDILGFNRIRTSKLMDGRPSVLIESSISASGVITDILACKSGQVVNITLDESLGVSNTARNAMVWCRDINGDEVLDVPQLEPLPTLPEASSYYMTRWYDYRVSGRESLVATTFMNNTDSWYMFLPDKWIGNVTVRRQDILSGERSVVFSYIGKGLENAEDFLIIYTLSGDNREERAVSGKRFILAYGEEKIYSASILTGESFELDVDETEIRNNFNVLYTEWQTGVT